MKKLTSTMPDRQRLYEHKGHTYSVVDLTYLPKGMEAIGAEDMLKKMYGKAPWEAADITDEDHVEIMGRFATVKEAREWLEANR